MANEFFTILTATGKAKLAAAQTSGTPLQITQMAVGDGDNGAYYNPIESQTALKHETWRGALNNLSVDASNLNWIVAELVIPDTVGGFYIREVGLFDSTGALIAVGKFPESYKPTLAAGSNKQLYVRMILEVSNASAVTLLIDPSVVLATRATVDQRIAEELAKLDGKPSVKVATTAAITLTGFQAIDGIALAAGDRVLVKDQAAAKDNGIYVAAAGAWARAADADASIEVTPGLFVSVEQGTANADSIWQLVTDGPITLGTTGLAFEMFAGKTGVAAGTYRSVTVDQRGRVVGGTNPTSAGGYGITDLLPNGYINGLAIANNATVPNTDIDVSPGRAKDAAGTIDLVLAAGLTKHLQSAGAWAAGNNGNGLFSGAKANSTWYHVFAIRKDSDGSVDVGFDTSFVAANRPAGYTAFRRIGSVKTNASGNVIAFLQVGRAVWWKTPILDVSANVAAGATLTYTLSVPPGLSVTAKTNLYVSGGDAGGYLAHPDFPAITVNYLPANYVGGMSGTSNSTAEYIASEINVLTNDLGQVKYTGLATAANDVRIATLGWIEQ